MWFERDELRRAKDNAEPWVRWLDDDIFAATEEGEASTQLCPSAGEPMRTLTYPFSKVRVEVCVADHGVWLEKGEFESIIKTLDELTNSMSVEDYQQATLTQLKDVFRPHESRMSEIKDFFAAFKLLEMRYGTEHPHVGRLLDAAARVGL